jgi:hypothetical protein
VPRNGVHIFIDNKFHSVMSFYSKGSKFGLLSISVIIILISIFLSKYDRWAIDLFYSLALFSLIIVIDFMFFELFCPYNYGRDHLVFCIFPMHRIRVLIIEIKSYLRRWEVFVLLFSILFYISFFYFNNNLKLFPLIIILALYIIQYIYLIVFIFIIKFFLGNTNFRVNIKNFTSIFISITIMLVILVEKSNVARQIFYLNPFSCGFLSFLVSKENGVVALITISCLTVFLGLIVQRKFQEWPHY